MLDPAHAPGTGTPEAGGMTSRELLEIMRGFRGLNLVGADVVEVAPAYDHAEITGVAAATSPTTWSPCWRCGTRSDRGAAWTSARIRATAAISSSRP